MTSPFGGGFDQPFPSMFGGGNDFDFPSSPKPNNQSKIDVDRILKNIDAKIAELEEEEKKANEQENLLNKTVSQTDSKATIDTNSNNSQELVKPNINEAISNAFKDDLEELTSPSNISDNNTNIQNIISDFNDEKFISKDDDNNIVEHKDTPENIDELIDKIKEQTKNNENITPNMNLVEENKYQEVNDDEFFDDFFD